MNNISVWESTVVHPFTQHAKGEIGFNLPFCLEQYLNMESIAVHFKIFLWQLSVLGVADSARVVDDSDYSAHGQILTLTRLHMMIIRVTFDSSHTSFTFKAELLGFKQIFLPKIKASSEIYRLRNGFQWKYPLKFD